MLPSEPADHKTAATTVYDVLLINDSDRRVERYRNGFHEARSSGVYDRHDRRLPAG